MRDSGIASLKDGVASNVSYRVDMGVILCGTEITQKLAHVGVHVCVTTQSYTIASLTSRGRHLFFLGIYKKSCSDAS